MEINFTTRGDLSIHFLFSYFGYRCNYYLFFFFVYWNSLLSGFRDRGGVISTKMSIDSYIYFTFRLWSKHLVNFYILYLFLFFGVFSLNKMLTLRTHTRVKRKNWSKTIVGNKLIHRIVRDVWPSKCFQLLLLPVLLLRCVVKCVRPTRFLDYSQFFNFRLFFCVVVVVVSLSRELITRSAGSHGNDFLFMTSYRLSWKKKKKYIYDSIVFLLYVTHLPIFIEWKEKKITKLRCPIRSRTAATCTSSDSAWKCRNKGK